MCCGALQNTGNMERSGYSFVMPGLESFFGCHSSHERGIGRVYIAESKRMVKVSHHPYAGNDAMFPCVVLHRLVSISAKRYLIAEALQESPKHSPIQLCARNRSASAFLRKHQTSHRSIHILCMHCICTIQERVAPAC